MEMKDMIKTNRLRLKLSQRELGERIGVNKAAVQKWECGKVTNLKHEVIVKLADIFDISIDELYAVSSTTTIFDEWDKKFNPDGKLADEVAEIENLCNMYKIRGGEGNISVLFDEKNISILVKAIYGEQAAKIVEALATLNQTGKDEAVKRIDELAKLQDYTK